MKPVEIVGTVLITVVAVLPIGMFIGYSFTEPEEPEPTIKEIADQLCLDWMRQEQNSAVQQAVEAAAEIGKDPVDIHNALVARCPPYWEAARSLPPESFK